MRSFNCRLCRKNSPNFIDAVFCTVQYEYFRLVRMLSIMICTGERSSTAFAAGLRRRALFLLFDLLSGILLLPRPSARRRRHAAAVRRRRAAPARPSGSTRLSPLSDGRRGRSRLRCAPTYARTCARTCFCGCCVGIAGEWQGIGSGVGELFGMRENLNET